MDFYKYLNKYIIYPLYHFKSGDKRLQHLKQLEINKALPKADLEKLQLRKLKSIVEYAYENTPYYRELFDAVSLKPSDINTLKDIEKIPPLSKQNIQAAGKLMLSSEYDVTSLMKDASGGSTGEPTVIYRDLLCHQLRHADPIRHDRWSGWDIGDRFALIWGAQRDLKATKSIKEFIISRFIARIWELDAFEMNKNKMDSYVANLERIQPKMILGYASALVAFSKFLIKHHPDHNILPSGIISSAEMLTEDMREIIEKAFKCKVLNRYGSREVGLIASECKHQAGLHINADNVFVEVVKDGKSVPIGENGEILVTDFSNHGMPLIRYKLGDMGCLSVDSCSCGITLPLMKSVDGRVADFFVSNEGTLVHGEYFTHLFYGIEEVEKFQMIQEKIDLVTLKIVSKNSDKCTSYLKFVEKKTKEILGDKCVLDICFVDTIAPSASGKYLFTMSKVSH